MVEESDWTSRIATQIGKRVAYFRSTKTGTGRRARMSAQALADLTAELGHPLDRSVIAKLEKGLRNHVTVPDILVLARALGVPPLALVFPIGSETNTEILPGQNIDTWIAARWFTGEGFYPSPDDPSGRGIPDPAAPQISHPDAEAVMPFVMFRAHDQIVREWEKAKGQFEAISLAEGENPGGPMFDLMKRYEQLLQKRRQEMRRHGIEPPALPGELAQVIKNLGRDDPQA